MGEIVFLTFYKRDKQRIKGILQIKKNIEEEINYLEPGPAH